MNSKNYDTVVIGGGIIGLMSAYYLNKQGQSVLIIDKGPEELACSHANCGLVSPSHALPLNSPELILKSIKWMFQDDSPFYIKPQMTSHFWSWMLGFGMNARSEKVKRSMEGRSNLLLNSRYLYDELFSDEDINCNWSKQGIMFAFEQEDSFEGYRSKDKILTELDSSLKAVPLVNEELRKKEPAINENVHGGWWYEIDASLKPDELVLGVRNKIQKNGVDFAFDTEVIGFETSVVGVSKVLTTKGSFKGNNYVLATGAWSPEIGRQLDIKIPILPGKGYSITMKQPDISPKMPCIMEEKKVVATPWNGTYRLGGTMEFTGYNSEINTKRFAALKKAAEIYMKDPYTDEVIEHWFGWRPMTNNGMPIIDFSQKHPNLLMACGHNMLGLSMATSTGKLVSEMLCNQSPHIDPSYYTFRTNLN